MDTDSEYISKCIDFFDKVVEVKRKKDYDYNSGIINRDMYFLHGVNTGVDELYKKILRLISLTSNDSKPKNESIEDTLIDITGYAADLYIYIKKKQKGK